MKYDYLVLGHYNTWDKEPEAVSAVPRTAREIVVDHKEIELLAYYHWIERGCPLGSPELDWFRAEFELKSRAAAATRRPPARSEPAPTHVPMRPAHEYAGHRQDKRLT